MVHLSSILVYTFLPGKGKALVLEPSMVADWSGEPNQLIPSDVLFFWVDAIGGGIAYVPRLTDKLATDVV